MSDETKAWDWSQYSAEMRRLRKQVAYAKTKLAEAESAGATGYIVAGSALKELKIPDGEWSHAPKVSARIAKAKSRRTGGSANA